MRLWSLHPKHLDAQGLVAVWREALLAQAVLRGRTRGYRNHPQLERFRAMARPLAGIASYLRVIHEEATRRGYRFDARRIGRGGLTRRIPVGRGQVAHEWRHLISKLAQRDPVRRREMAGARPAIHPVFRCVPGGLEPWERRSGKERAASIGMP